MRASKLAIFTSATSELLEDALIFESEFMAQTVRAIGWSLDDAFLNGTGAGQPQGVLSAPSKITVTKESGQAADTIQFQNLKKIFGRMHPASRMRSVWVANNDSIPQLLELFATDGTSSTHIPVLTEGGPTGFKVLTRPIIFTEKVPALGDTGDIGLYDFSKYIVMMRRVAGTERSVHEGWSTDEVHFRTILRAQVMDSWDSAFTPKNGPTLGWAVVVADRA